MTLSELRNIVERRKGAMHQIQSDISGGKARIKKLKKDIKKFEKASVIIKEVGLKTQRQLSFNISELTTLALTAVMKDPYDLEVNFIERRDKTECDLLFSREGAEIDPYHGGGGAIDIAAFALRVASWSMQSPKMRNVLILDEPFQNLKGEQANRRMLEMVNQISKKLNVQIIMVSDERVSRAATIEATDVLFETTLKKGITKITRDD